MRYRDVEFYFHEWKDYKNELQGEFTCRDKELLKNSDLSIFTAEKLDDIHGKIDFFLDNKESLLHNKEILNKQNEG